MRMFLGVANPAVPPANAGPVIPIGVQPLNFTINSGAVNLSAAQIVALQFFYNDSMAINAGMSLRQRRGQVEVFMRGGN